jgi:hypothetical protein
MAFAQIFMEPWRVARGNRSDRQKHAGGDLTAPSALFCSGPISPNNDFWIYPIAGRG